MTPRTLRRATQLVFVAAIAGMIVSFIRDANAAAVGFGVVAAVGAMTLMLVTALAGPDAYAHGAIDDALAADIEARITGLVRAGADEAEVRAVVRRAVDLGRRAGPPPGDP